MIVPYWIGVLIYLGVLLAVLVTGQIIIYKLDL